VTSLKLSTIRALSVSSNTGSSSTVEKPHFYISSGGNAGLASIIAARSLGCPSSVVTPLTTNPQMISMLHTVGATEVIQHGANWQEADNYLRDVVLKRNPNGVYVPPFDNPDVWAGHSTMIHEMKKQWADVEAAGNLSNESLPEKPDAIICSVGGGGLFSGVQMGLEAVGWSDVSVFAVETRGADSLNAAVNKGELVTLPAITSKAASLGAVRVAGQALVYAKRPNVTSLVLSDAEAALACCSLANGERIMVELACGVNVALCYDGKLASVFEKIGKKFTSESKVIIVLCGGCNVSTEMLTEWSQEYGKSSAAADQLSK
jgi:L-serine/L-threonine ammonia-lyase